MKINRQNWLKIILLLAIIILLIIFLSRIYSFYVYLCVASVINCILYIHRRFYPQIHISIELTPCFAINAYYQYGLHPAIATGVMVCIFGIIASNCYHPWNFLRIPSIIVILYLLRFFYVSQLFAYVVFFIFLYNIILFVIYHLTGMNLSSNISHQASNTLANIIAVSYFF